MSEEIKYDIALDEELRPRMVKCRLIHHEGEASLVEWVTGRGVCHRAIIPSEEVDIITLGLTGVMVSEDVLAVGIPYGLPMEEFIEISVTPKMLANELRRAGIWTYQDLVMNPEKVRGVFGKCFGLDYATLKKKAKRYKEVSHE